MSRPRISLNRLDLYCVLGHELYRWQYLHIFIEWNCMILGVHGHFQNRKLNEMFFHSLAVKRSKT